jgi:hypothetical protein
MQRSDGAASACVFAAKTAMADRAQQVKAPRIGLGWVLAGIALGFAAFNTATTWLFPESGAWEELEAIIIGFWAFEPMLFATWAAIGPGRFIIRAPLIILCLVLVVVAPGLDSSNFTDVEQFEFVVLLIAAFGIFAAATLVMLLLRLFVGWRLEQRWDDVGNSDRPLQYDTKYLILLVTLCALALGITFNVKFGPADPPNLFSGPGFYVYIMAIGSVVIGLLHLPMLATPLWVLTDRPSKKYYRRAVALWFLVTLSTGLFWISQDVVAAARFPPLIQFGGAVAGVVAAWPLRWAGCRLVNIKPGAV